jgi:hypothetical protein
VLPTGAPARRHLEPRHGDRAIRRHQLVAPATCTSRCSALPVSRRPTALRWRRPRARPTHRGGPWVTLSIWSAEPVPSGGTAVRHLRAAGSSAGRRSRSRACFGLAARAALRDGANEGPQVVGLAQAVARADSSSPARRSWAGGLASCERGGRTRGPGGRHTGHRPLRRVEAGRRETMAAGYSGTYAVASSLATWPAFAADPARALAVRAESVARTWSPPTPA